MCKFSLIWNKINRIYTKTFYIEKKPSVSTILTDRQRHLRLSSKLQFIKPGWDTACGSLCLFSTVKYNLCVIKCFYSQHRRQNVWENSGLACAVSAVSSSPREQSEVARRPRCSAEPNRASEEGKPGGIEDPEYNCHSPLLPRGTVTTVKKCPTPLMSIVAGVIT